MEATTSHPGRHAHRWRCLRESWLQVDVDLDRAQPVAVRTDSDALSRAIERLAASGGFALALDGEGGPCADARLVVEDCGYELGAALREALGPAASGIAIHGACDTAAASALPAPLAAAFIESLGRALGAEVRIAARGERHEAGAEIFTAAGRAIRAAARGREALSRR
jgi:imidazoleglycerol phosphate dehydratase HisB